MPAKQHCIKKYKALGIAIKCKGGRNVGMGTINRNVHMKGGKCKGDWKNDNEEENNEENDNEDGYDGENSNEDN